MAADEKYAQASPKQQRKLRGHIKTSKDLWRVSYQSMLAKMKAHYRDIREDENSFPGLMNASLSDPICDYIAGLTDKIEKGLREDASDVSDPTRLDGQEDFGEDDNRSDASGGTESTSVRNDTNGSDSRTKSLRRWPNQKFSEIEVLLVIGFEEFLYAQNLNSPTIRDIGEKTNAALKQLISLAKGKQADTEMLTDGLPLPSTAKREDTSGDVSMARMVVHYIKELRKYNLEVQQPLLRFAKKLTERYELLEESGDNHDVFKLVLKVREASSLYARDLREYNIKHDQELAIDPEVLRWSNIIVQLRKGDEETAKIVEVADYPYTRDSDWGNSINYIVEKGHHRFAFQVANALFEYAKKFVTEAPIPIDHRILYAARSFLDKDEIARKGMARKLGLEITYPPSNEERALKFDDNSHCLVFLDLMARTFSGTRSYNQLNGTYLIALEVFSKFGPAGARSKAIGIEPTDPWLPAESAYQELAGILVKARTVDGVQMVLLILLGNYADHISIGGDFDDRLLAELESIREQAKGKVDAEPEIDETLDVENINDWGYSGYVAVMARIYAHMARKFGKEIDIEVLSEVTALIDQANKKASEDEIERGRVAELCTCDDCLSEAADFECGPGRCNHPVPITLRELNEEGKSSEIDTEIESKQSEGIQSDAETGALEDEPIVIESPSVEDFTEKVVDPEAQEESDQA